MTRCTVSLLAATFPAAGLRRVQCVVMRVGAGRRNATSGDSERRALGIRENPLQAELPSLCFDPKAILMRCVRLVRD